VRFVVADVGLALHWVSEEESYTFWKRDVLPHLVDDSERPFDIYDYPEAYAYTASVWVAEEWEAIRGTLRPLVVLERHH